MDFRSPSRPSSPGPNCIDLPGKNTETPSARLTQNEKKNENPAKIPRKRIREKNLRKSQYRSQRRPHLGRTSNRESTLKQRADASKMQGEIITPKPPSTPPVDRKQAQPISQDYWTTRLIFESAQEDRHRQKVPVEKPLCGKLTEIRIRPQFTQGAKANPISRRTPRRGEHPRQPGRTRK